MAASTLRQRLVGGFAGAALAVSAAVAPSVASADTAQPGASGTQIQMVDGVPQVDVRGESVETAHAMAAAVSDKAIAIVYYGNDMQIESATREAAANLRASDWPVGIILADGNDAMEVYVDGLSIAETAHVTADAQQIREAVINSYQRYLEARDQMAEAPTAAPN